MTLEPAALLALRFVLDERGRMIGTNEPLPERAPRMTMIRSATSSSCALRVDLDDAIADRIAAIAPDDAAERYRDVLGGAIDSGPTFSFATTSASERVVEIDSLEPLVRHLRGWNAAEIPACRPILAICDGADAISVCFCARRSTSAAEAGVYTSESHRGRGLAPVVTAAWASAIRASGRTPVYSTSWTNAASLAVARKLGLVQFATQLNVVDVVHGCHE